MGGARVSRVGVTYIDVDGGWTDKFIRYSSIRCAMILLVDFLLFNSLPLSNGCLFCLQY